MDINELIRPWKEGSISSLSLDELRKRSQRCVVFIQNRVPEATWAKAAFDAEIRCREEKEQADRLAGQISKIDGRLETVEQTASRPEAYTWGFWLAVSAIIIAVCSWLFPRPPAGVPPVILTNQPPQLLAAPTNAAAEPLPPSMMNIAPVQSNVPATNSSPKL